MPDPFAALGFQPEDQDPFAALGFQPIPIPGTEKTGLPGVPLVAGSRIEEQPKLGVADVLPAAISIPLFNVGKGFAASLLGFGQALEPLGSSMERDAQAAGKTGLVGGPVKKLGQAIGKWKDALDQATIEPLRRYEGKTIDTNPELARDPVYLSGTMAQAIGSVAAFMIPGKGVGTLAGRGIESLAPKLVESKPLLAAAAKILGTNAAGSALESVVNATDNYETAKQAYGADEQSALEVFGTTLRRDLPVTGVTNMLGLYSPHAGPLWLKAVHVLADVGLEGYQEVAQGDIAHGVLRDKFGNRVPESRSGRLEDFIGGAGSGLLLGIGQIRPSGRRAEAGEAPPVKQDVAPTPVAPAKFRRPPPEGVLDTATLVRHATEKLDTMRGETIGRDAVEELGAGPIQARVVMQSLEQNGVVRKTGNNEWEVVQPAPKEPAPEPEQIPAAAIPASGPEGQPEPVATTEKGANPPAGGTEGPSGPASVPPTDIDQEFNKRSEVPLSSLSVDPARFQYKQEGVGQGGVTDEFREVRKWDPEKAGTIAVWRDPEDNKVYVVNGHHRYEMANRLGAKSVSVRFLRAKTAREAVLKGATINIAEDRGTALDAAKVFREVAGPEGDLAGYMEEEGISLKGKVAADGMALARLSPALFREVVDGEMPVARAVVYGRLASHEDQEAIHKIVQGKHITNNQLEELIRQQSATATPQRVERQESLFGEEIFTRSLILEKAQVSDYVREQLRDDRRMFGVVGKQKAADRLARAGNVIDVAASQQASGRANQELAVYDKLSVVAGEISDALNSAAEKLADGAPADKVKQEAYDTIRPILVSQIEALTGAGKTPGEGNVRHPEGVGGERGRETGERQHGGEAQAERLRSVRTGVRQFLETRIPRAVVGKRTGTVYLNAPAMRLVERALDEQDLEGTSLSAADARMVVERLLGRGHERIAAAISGAGAATRGSVNIVLADKSVNVREVMREEGIHSEQRAFALSDEAIGRMEAIPAVAAALRALPRDYAAASTRARIYEAVAKVLGGQDLGLTIGQRLAVARAYRAEVLNEYGQNAVAIFRWVKPGPVKEAFKDYEKESAKKEDRVAAPQGVLFEGGPQLQRGAGGRGSREAAGTGRGGRLLGGIGGSVEPVARIVGHVRALRGGSQAQLVRASDGKYYVAKFVDNEQGPNVPVVELIAGRLIHALGLNTPYPVVLQYDGGIDGIAASFRNQKTPYKAGLAVATPYVGGDPNVVAAYNDLPTRLLDKVENKRDIAMALAADKWLNQFDSRQVVFTKGNGNRFTAHLIDHGYCLGAGANGSWMREAGWFAGLYHDKLVYNGIRSLRDFDPVLSRINTMDPDFIRAVVTNVPEPFRAHAQAEDMEELADYLIARRRLVNDSLLSLAEFHKQDIYKQGIFANWGREPDAPPERREQPQMRLFARKRNRIEGQTDLFDFAATAALGEIREVADGGLTREEATATAQWLDKANLPGAEEAARELRAAALHGKQVEFEERPAAEEPAGQRTLLGDQLTAGMAASLTPEEKRRKLKRAPSTQASMFEEEKPEQGGLFGGGGGVYIGSGFGALQPYFDRGAKRLLAAGRSIGAAIKPELLADAANMLLPLDTRLARQGTLERRLVKSLKDAGTWGEVSAGKRLARLADSGLERMTRAQGLDLVDAMEGRRPPTDPAVASAFRIARWITDDIAKEAEALEVERFARRRNYYPHVTRPEALRKGALRNPQLRHDTLENMVRIHAANSLDNAERMLDGYLGYLEKKSMVPEELLRYLVSTGQASDMADALDKLKRDTLAARRYGNLEYRRELNLPFWDPDPRRVLPSYIASASIRLAQIAEFGETNRAIKGIVLHIARTGGNADFAIKATDRMLGEINKAEEAEERFSRAARMFHGFALGLAALPNSTQTLNSLLVADLPSVAAGVRAAFTARGRRFGIESGATIDPVLHESVRELATSSRALDYYLRAVGFTPVERFNRVVAANTGAVYAERLVEQEKRGSKRARKALAELLGGEAGARQAIARGRLTAEEVLFAAHRFTDLTQFRARPEDMPLFASTPLGRVFWQFKNFSYQQTRLLHRTIVDEFAAGHFGRGFRNLMILAVLFPLAGEAVNDLRALLKGKPRKDSGALARYLDDVAQAGLGIVYDALQSAGWRRGVEFVAGPTVTTVGQVGNALAGPHPARDLAKRAEKITPLYDVGKNLLNQATQ